MILKRGARPSRLTDGLWVHPGLLRSQLDLTQAEMAAALGVTANTWARWERGELAIHPAYQLLLDLIEHRADRDAERTAARLRAPNGVRNLW
jgi:transcriptional regulator with XRE-family HTH domain